MLMAKSGRTDAEVNEEEGDEGEEMHTVLAVRWRSFA